MPKTVSVRSSKQDILNAYEELTRTLEQKDLQMSVPTSTRKDAAKSNEQSPHTIVNRLGELRIEITKNLGEIVDKLVSESEMLQLLKEEAATIRTEIETMHQIKVHATTLKNLISLHEDKQKELEQTASQQREQWELEQQQHEKEVKEARSELEKHRKREAEEYQYTVKMNRQKDEDAYNEKRKQIEATLAAREAAIKVKEDEFKTLQKQVVDLEKRLETEVTRARKETADQVTRDLEIKHNLERKGIEGERKISQLTIDNLQKTIRVQEDDVKDLKTQLQKATQQIKDIAVSVIDAQKPVIMPAPPAKAPTL